MVQKKKTKAFERLLNIVDELREKCPWDRKQTIESLRMLTIEETYELADAISAGDMEGINEELGDLMLHILMYSRIASEKNAFDIHSVMERESEKLIRRHPHIYGRVKADSVEKVKQNWEELKLKEGKKSIFEGIPSSLPALIKAYRLQDKAAQVGFDWEDIGQVREKIKEEEQELDESIREGDKEGIEEEFGDLLFSMINYARFLKIDPENALDKTNRKFMSRFKSIEKIAAGKGMTISEMSLEELDKLWNDQKKSEHKKRN